MEISEEHRALLDEDSISGVAERKTGLGNAIDTLRDQLEQNHTRRREIDAQDEQLYETLKKLDAAYARISRGKRYTDKTKKAAVRRFWTDETHVWVERYLFEWARRQLQEGSKSAWSFHGKSDPPVSIADVITVMSHHPETFVEQKSTGPKPKYARRNMEWTLTTTTNRFMHGWYRQPWDVESAIMDTKDERTLTFSERMHGMMEDAIQAFYAKSYTSIIHAFSDLYWKEFAHAFCYYRARTNQLEAEIKAKQEPAPPATS